MLRAAGSKAGLAHMSPTRLRRPGRGGSAAGEGKLHCTGRRTPTSGRLRIPSEEGSTSPPRAGRGATLGEGSGSPSRPGYHPGRGKQLAAVPTQGETSDFAPEWNAVPPREGQGVLPHGQAETPPQQNSAALPQQDPTQGAAKKRPGSPTSKSHWLTAYRWRLTPTARGSRPTANCPQPAAHC